MKYGDPWDKLKDSRAEKARRQSWDIAAASRIGEWMVEPCPACGDRSMHRFPSQHCAVSLFLKARMSDSAKEQG